MSGTQKMPPFYLTLNGKAVDNLYVEKAYHDLNELAKDREGMEDMEGSRQCSG